MTDFTKKITRLRDYCPPKFRVESLALEFELAKENTVVKSKMKVEKLLSDAIFTLDGDELQLQALLMDGKQLAAESFEVTPQKLTIFDTPAIFTLEIEVSINPMNNTQLSGLYLSNNIFCTQCEAEGFRRITYFFDRPDYLTQFSVKLIADQNLYPVLLSNGNCTSNGKLSNGKHFACWKDPFPKPSYLFALVAGQLDFIEDQFITRSKRSVILRIYTELGQQNKATYAMHALKQAMKWDEEIYHREYDLDIFMIVAVSDFNMGAMENKGLNLFNAKYILASPETATDMDYQNIAAVIAHEYFHNWSGNRVTCRDWFQLSLKEGFTVFREQCYSADITSAAVKRIQDVNGLRTLQFNEDKGPMAHPVQPDSYLEIDNFYTHTVYEKGAEVIRMLKTLIGDRIFYRGTDIYFSSNDGKAVTINELIAAMEQASGHDLSQFKLWYTQAGTPKLLLKTDYHEKTAVFTLTVQQIIPPTADQPQQVKQPMLIPFSMALYHPNGERLEEKLLRLSKAQETFVFENIPTKPIPSWLNDFSAPIEVEYDYSLSELQFLMRHDQNFFARYEAGQIWARQLFCEPLPGKILPGEYLDSLRMNLISGIEDKAFLAELMQLPTEKYLLGYCRPIDISSKHNLYRSFECQIATSLYDDLMKTYHKNKITIKKLENIQVQQQARKLKNLCLWYLVKTGLPEAIELAYCQYQQADNMTDRMTAFQGLLTSQSQYAEDVISDFYQKFKQDALVLDKWFAAQARVDAPETLEKVLALTDHPAFNWKNPNKVRSLIGVFAHDNIGQFHRSDGKGYEVLASTVIRLNGTNSGVAARLLQPLIQWHDFTEPHRSLMKTQLERIRAEKLLSADVFEVVEKALK